MTEPTALADDIWIVEGPAVPFFGIPYSTRMVVIRIEDQLWVWSPIAVDEELARVVDSWGRVRWLVEPNSLHHLFLTDWLTRFPQAEAWAPPGLASKRPDIPFVGELTDEPPESWAEVVEQTVFEGSLVMAEVLFFHRPSSTCLVGDLIQRHDVDAFSIWQRLLMRADGMVGEEGSTPREWRATFLDRARTRRALDRALAWNPRHLILAHGRCALGDGARVLESNLGWVRRPWPM